MEHNYPICCLLHCPTLWFGHLDRCSVCSLAKHSLWFCQDNKTPLPSNCTWVCSSLFVTSLCRGPTSDQLEGHSKINPVHTEATISGCSGAAWRSQKSWKITRLGNWTYLKWKMHTLYSKWQLHWRGYAFTHTRTCPSCSALRPSKGTWQIS